MQSYSSAVVDGVAAMLIGPAISRIPLFNFIDIKQNFSQIFKGLDVPVSLVVKPREWGFSYHQTTV